MLVREQMAYLEKLPAMRVPANDGLTLLDLARDVPPGAEDKVPEARRAWERLRASRGEGVSAMKMSWQTEAVRLVCRWSELGERVPYNSRWIQDASRIVHGRDVSPSVLVFTKLSPFGGREWYAPDPVGSRHLAEPL